VLRLALRYAGITSLSEMPDVSPYSEDFLEYGTVPGVEYIYNELQANLPSNGWRRPSCCLRSRSCRTSSGAPGKPAQGQFLVESEQLVIRFQRMVLSALS